VQTLIADVLSFWKPTFEIIILWIIIYNILLFFTGTRAFQVVRGIIVIIVIFFIAQRFQLQTLEWLLTKLFAISVIAILIIFQPEIRRGLARLGQRQLFSIGLREKEVVEILEKIVDAVDSSAQKRIGCIIAIEREANLKIYIDSGISLDCMVSSELIQTIFTPSTILHDGAMVIQGNRIVAAGCLLPLTERTDIAAYFGTRHRAALGLSEETDALVIVTSEETGGISLAINGRLISGLKKDDLFRRLKTHVAHLNTTGGNIEI